MAVTESVSILAFRVCLNFLNRLARPEREPVVITRLKRTVALLTPPDRHADAVHNIHGFMRGSVIIAEDADLTAPLLEPGVTAASDLHG